MACNVNPSSVKVEESCDSTGGMSYEFYYALVSDVADPFPAPPANPVDFAAGVTVTTDFTMVATKTFHTIEADLFSVSLGSVSEGEENNLSMKNDLKFRISGKSKTVSGFINSYLNKKLILVVPDNGNSQRLLGSKRIPAIITSAQEMSGEKNADNKTFEIIITVYGSIPYYYEAVGGIPLPV
jgi:hypothetical protein